MSSGKVEIIEEGHTATENFPEKYVFQKQLFLNYSL